MATEAVNETGRWLLQSGCHRGTLMSRDGGTSEHASEAGARAELGRQMEFWGQIGYRVWYAHLVPPGAPYSESITLHPGVPYAS